LKQGQYVPIPVERQVVTIFAGVNGYLDKHPVEKLLDYEQQLAALIVRKYPEIYKDIVSSGKIDDALKAKLEQVLKEFDTIFVA
jgi:F-type H+-transporting ATPase subunit alpha